MDDFSIIFDTSHGLETIFRVILAKATLSNEGI